MTALLVAAPGGAPNSPAAPATGKAQIVVIQALPGETIAITLDGRMLRRQAQAGSIVGPVSVSPGRHRLTFSGAAGAQTMTSELTLAAGASNDVVLHQPASVDGRPVVNTYDTPVAPIGPGKARVLLAHTATIPPADVELDGRVVFTNIANGEFADADVPAGSHRVALLPTDKTADPYLGPLDVRLAAETATMVYAVGNPRNGSMTAITHTVQLPADGSTVPQKIDTGSAGLVADARTVPFSPTPQVSALRPDSSGRGELYVLASGLGLLLLTVPLARRRRRRFWPTSGR